MMRNWLHVRRGLSTLSVACALVFGVPSCALQDPPPRSEVVVKALPSTTKIPPGWTPASTIGQDVVNGWVKTFNDAGLEAIVNEAIAHNTDLRKAAATVEVARQSAALAGARLKPQVGLHAGESAVQDKDQDDAFRSNNVWGQVGWELDIWGRLRSERAGAIATYQATALDYAFARQSLAATTAHTSYWRSKRGSSSICRGRASRFSPPSSISQRRSTPQATSRSSTWLRRPRCSAKRKRIWRARKGF